MPGCRVLSKKWTSRVRPKWITTKGTLSAREGKVHNWNATICSETSCPLTCPLLLHRNFPDEFQVVSRPLSVFSKQFNHMRSVKRFVDRWKVPYSLGRLRRRACRACRAPVIFVYFDSNSRWLPVRFHTESHAYLAVAAVEPCQLSPHSHAQPLPPKNYSQPTRS